MLQPCQVLEDIKSICKKGYSEMFVENAIDTFSGLLRKTVVFNFEYIEFQKEHCQFGSKMLFEDVLQLPFFATGISYKIEYYGKGIVDALSVVVKTGEQSLAVLACIKPDKNSYALPYLFFQFSIKEEIEEKVKLKYDFVHHVIKKESPFNFLDNIESLENELKSRSMYVLSHLSMLMSKGVNVEEDDLSKTNKLRRMRKKPLINKRYKVYIGGKKKEYKGSDSENGSYKKPIRVHWRRGHIRTIHKGTEKQRLIPVAPCVVGASEEDDNPIAKKMYQMVGANANSRSNPESA